MRGNSWSCVPATFSTQVENKEQMPECLKSFLNDEYYEIVIEFESSGYYDPGICSGPIEKSYPPEGEDERTPTEGYAENSNNERILFDQTMLEDVFNHYVEEIYEQEIEFPEEEYDD